MRRLFGKPNQIQNFNNISNDSARLSFFCKAEPFYLHSKSGCHEFSVLFFFTFFFVNSILTVR